MNRIVITGRLTRDPELRNTGNGTSVCNFSVAVDRPFSKENEVDFFNVVAWRSTADFVAKYFGKGKMIAVTGSMQARSYEDKSGNKRIAWELQADGVEFCGNKSDNGGGSDTAAPASAPTAKPAAASTGIMVEVDDNDNDLPF